MTKPAFILAALLGATTLTACATPTVVDVRQAQDPHLSCAQIAAELDEAYYYESEARDERGITGENIAAVAFFWPGLLVTAVNTEQAIDAAQDRRDHLLDIYDQKGCRPID
jgi:hypothetical protein